MIPTQLFLDSIAPLIAADPSGFADPTTFLKVTLIKNAFTPGAALVLGDVTAANFDGATPLHAADAAPAVFQDPITKEWIVQSNAPAGGWHWQVSGSTHLDNTIHGFIVTDHSGANLLGSELLPTPVVMNAVGLGVDIPDVRIRLGNLTIS